LGQRAALYCRVSTADQSCDRQERDLTAFAERAGYEVVGIYKETASGVRLDRAERRKVLALAQRREIDAVLVTELSRWGRSTTDLLASLKELEGRRVSLVALNGMGKSFPLSFRQVTCEAQQSARQTITGQHLGQPAVIGAGRGVRAARHDVTSTAQEDAPLSGRYRSPPNSSTVTPSMPARNRVARDTARMALFTVAPASSKVLAVSRLPAATIRTTIASVTVAGVAPRMNPSCAQTCAQIAHSTASSAPGTSTRSCCRFSAAI